MISLRQVEQAKMENVRSKWPSGAGLKLISALVNIPTSLYCGPKCSASECDATLTVDVDGKNKFLFATWGFKTSENNNAP